MDLKGQGWKPGQNFRMIQLNDPQIWPYLDTSDQKLLGGETGTLLP